MRAADKFYKLNRQTPGPSIHAQKAYYRKISANSPEKKYTYKIDPKQKISLQFQRDQTKQHQQEGSEQRKP